MPRSFRYVFVTIIIFLLFGGPVAYYRYCQAQVRNFQTVREGVLYRSGQLTLDGLRQVVHDYGIKTVVTLRDQTHPGRPMPDLEEEAFCGTEDINFVRITPRPWWAPDGSVPAEKGVNQFRDVMDQPANYPVLVHCYAGIHRTGAYCAIYRMEYEHWSNADALAELRWEGYSNLDDHLDILTYLESYQTRWKNHGEPPIFAREKKSNTNAAFLSKKVKIKALSPEIDNQ